MNKAMVLLAVLAVSLRGLAGDVGDGSERVLILPLSDLRGDCCDAAAEKALGGLEGVQSVRILATKDGKDAAVSLSEDATIRLSDVSKALDGASERMKTEGGMDVHYQIDGDRFTLDARATLLLGGVGDATRVRSALFAGVQGLDGAFVRPGEQLVEVRLRPSRASVSFMEVVGVVEELGGEVADVLVAVPSSGGAAGPAVYRCPMDGGERNTPGACPKCGMELGEEHRVAGAAGPADPDGEAQPADPGRNTAATYTCPMCGGEYASPGACPMCGMKLVLARTGATPQREEAPPGGGG